MEGHVWGKGYAHCSSMEEKEGNRSIIGGSCLWEQHAHCSSIESKCSIVEGHGSERAMFGNAMYVWDGIV